jgi:predicted metalloprotease with PDZ domain
VSVLVRVAPDSIDVAPAAHKATADKLRGGGERVARMELRPGLAPSGEACPGSSYVGVGVTADPRTERIILVGDDTPASRAGLQHDDIVLNPAVWRDAHRDGEVLRVQVLREGMTLTLLVRVGEICIE